MENCKIWIRSKYDYSTNFMIIKYAPIYFQSKLIRTDTSWYFQFNCLAAPECSSYTLLNEADRSVSFKGVAKCDSGLSTKWYRFSAAAGAAMPESCVPKNQCGTHAPGWLNGKNPTVAEGVVSRQVCYHWSSNCCLWKNNIRVRNCGGFYVYELRKPPACQLRYCGGPAIAGSLFLFEQEWRHLV